MPGLRLPPARAARFVAWGNEYLRGDVSLDEAAERVRGGDAWHRVDGLRGGDDVSLAVALGRLGAGGVRGLRLVLPAPGDVAGLPGPIDFNMEALAAGEAVLGVGADVGLVPTVIRYAEGGRRGKTEDAVRWRLEPTDPARTSCLTLREAERALAVAIREATDILTALDVAGADERTWHGVEAVRSGTLLLQLPPGYAPHASEVLARASRISALVTLAADSEGGSLSAAQLTARRDQLAVVARAARHAVEAAHNIPLEPSPPS